MRLLKTFLAAAAACAVMLLVASRLAGDLPGFRPRAGLTTEKILGGDVTAAAKAGVGAAGPERAALDRRTSDAARVGAPG